MKLNSICLKLIGELLGEPGTMVQRMKYTHSDVVKGGIYKVIKSEQGGTNLALGLGRGLSLSNSCFWAAECFRKVIE